MRITLKHVFSYCALLAIAFLSVASTRPLLAQDGDNQDRGYQDRERHDRNSEDPPGRVARLGYLEGSVSFLPAGENDWVGAVPNRPMTTGDQLWTDRDSRAEVQLGSAVIRLSANTGFSFLNLDDDTVQLQVTSGIVNITVRRLQDNDVFEIDTPNQAFSVFQPGHYRVEAGSDGNYTVISVRRGEGESTSNGQNYPLRGGQEGTFSGGNDTYADVEQLEAPDDFDHWSDDRDHRHDYARSSRYLAPDVVGGDDLDQYGDWRQDSNYGNVWFPNQVSAGWAPYHDGHWDWISPWGWTWVDDSSWGYAPFHYGRWVSVEGRWGWVAGPPAVRPVYAPALVVFVGGGLGALGGNVGWFPLGPREVYAPSYHVSEGYMNRVNVSNTNVNVTQVTNVYRTTIVNNNTTVINNTTNVTNVTYVNRNVQGGTTVVPQRAFASAQPVAKAAVQVNQREMASAPIARTAVVAPTRESVMGAKAATAGHVASPPAAIQNRQVVAKATPPPPPVPFARQQQALGEHPGQPLARTQVAALRPAAAAAPPPTVKVAPAGKPATPNMGRPADLPNRPNAPNRPASQPANNPPSNNQPANNGRPGASTPAAQPNRPAPGEPNRPASAEPNRPVAQPENNRPLPNQPENRPAPAQPNRPMNNQPENRPAEPPMNRPTPAQPENRPAQPENRPAPPANRQPMEPPNNRPASEPPATRPSAEQPNRAPAPQPENRPTPPANRPPVAQPENRPAPQTNRPLPPQQNEPQRNQPRESQPESNRPPQAQPNNRPNQPPPRQLTPEEKKRLEQEQKKQ